MASTGRRVLLATAVPVVAFIALIATASFRYSLPAPGTAAPVIRLYAGARPIGVAYPSHRAQDWVPLDEMPRYVVDAVVIAEDRRFWLHPGVDVRAVIRAARANMSRGEKREGASTITQQLARTLFLDNERTWSRKVREAFIALLLEVRYSKERILEAYLNQVYLGHDGDVAVHGVSAASRHFFGKDVASLRVDEAAWLATAIRAPNRLLVGGSTDARKLRDELIHQMQGEGMLAPAAARQALLQALVVRRSPDSERSIPYFVDVVMHELERRAQLSPSGETSVYTTLDVALQRAAEFAVRDGIGRIERKQPALAGKVQAAVVAIEPASGEIRALVGGSGYRQAPFNHATRALRQPGSLFKPFVYLTAFEMDRRGRGLTPASVVTDEPLVVQDVHGSWEPRNIDGQFHGPVTVRRALEESLNVPAIRVALNVGPKQVATVSHALGIERPLLAVPSLALGTSEVSLFEITAAFATLANRGVRVAPTSLAPEGRVGEPVIAPLPAPAQVVSAESAFMTTHLLRGVMKRGTGAASAAWGLQDVTAGKTGTTDGLRDAWFVGYTPDLVAGVWVGLDDGGALGLTGSQAALPIWGSVMQAAVRQSPPRPFTPPPGVVLAAVDRQTGRRVSFWCGSTDVVEEAFRVGTVPPDECTATVVFKREATSFFQWVRGLFK
ncbi:MAG: transpeptidase-transglycosylase [Candidatus Rokuibacteriota bacterium]|nr:MAG: transpeptidase-transglycosylase [Candidatus Rokubacteria bacterium]